MEAKQNDPISPPREKHSFGHYSLWTGLVAFLQFICTPCFLVLFIGPFMVGRPRDSAFIQTVDLLPGISAALFFVGGLLGLVLGVVGLFKDDKKTKAILGLGLSVLWFLILVFFAALASALGK
jgi:hypothetical protein